MSDPTISSASGRTIVYKTLVVHNRHAWRAIGHGLHSMQPKVSNY